MLEFAILIFVCILYIYQFERRIRHEIVNGLNPFDEFLIKKAGWIAKRCGNRPAWSNTILAVGIILSVLLVIASIILKSNEISAFLPALALLVQFGSITFAGNFSGSTWVNRARNFMNSLSDNFNIRFFGRLLFELWSFISFIMPFILFVALFLFNYADGSNSSIRVYLILYFLPVFFVLWTYRIGDYDEFNLNVRRLIVYSIVAIFVLFTNDPLEQLKLNSNPANKTIDFLNLIGDFSIIAFIAFDRIGKVIIEIMTKSIKKIEVKESSAVGADII